MSEHRDYDAPPLDVADVDPDPIAQFRTWFEEARALSVYEPEAMLLSTAGLDGGPRTRYVLMRGLDERGLAFFTNYNSDKAREIDAEPRVSLTFGWLPLHRQVRVTGRAERLPEAESDAYFASRPRGAQLGAWASPQSAVLGSRAELEALVADAAGQFPGEVPRPEFWGGYLVRPDTVELWQGRPSRLHDRLRYRRLDDGWMIERLAP